VRAPEPLRDSFPEARFFGRDRTRAEESPLEPVLRFVTMRAILSQELSQLDRDRFEAGTLLLSGFIELGPFPAGAVKPPIEAVPWERVHLLAVGFKRA
jgi:hypothetical protein